MALIKVSNKIQGHPDWHATSLEDFEEWVEIVKGKTDTTIYRGQRNYWPLLPSISRNNDLEMVLVHERELLEKFKNEAPRTLQLVPNSDWDWLVVAQHHGLPTRLLDWSFNPYVALWFAIKKAKLNDSNPEVWVMNPLIDDVVQSLDKARPFSGKRTKIFKPNFNIPRVRAQNGCFTLFKYVESVSKRFVPLEKNKYLGKRLVRVRITKNSLTIILKQLRAMGFKKSMMFPDTDGVARKIKEEVFSKKV
jgi:FRG domain